MSTTKTGGIFTFDHDYKKLNKAIGVEEGYLDDLGNQVSAILKDVIFDDDNNIRDDGSQSRLVEICANEFSYSQLVILSSFYLQDKIEGFAKTLSKKVKNMGPSVRAINLDAEDLPDNIKEMLNNLTEGRKKGEPIDGDSLPPELNDFLKKLAEEQERQEGDGDDD
jgi:hypothetical protein